MGGALGDGQLLSLAVDGRHLDFSTEGGAGEGDGHLEQQVVAFALEVRVVGDANDDVQIAPDAGAGG